MAVQAGIGVSRFILLLGAGYGGSIMISNGKMSDLLDGIKELVKRIENSSDSANSDNDPIVTQVRWLAQEVRQLASSKPITVFNGGSTQNDLTSLIIPAATLGALGYGYMWWKSLSFSDLMFVTKRNMETAVSNLTTHLEGITEFLAKTKKHLAQRIETLDTKIDDQKEISKLIMKDVVDTRADIEQITSRLLSAEGKFASLDHQFGTLNQKQDLLLHGMDYLCETVNSMSTTSRVPQLREQLKSASKSFGLLPTSRPLGLQCLEEILDIASAKEIESTKDGDIELNKMPTSQFLRSTPCL